MKRRLSLLLMIVLLCVLPSAQADVPQISGSLFSSAKDALVCLASFLPLPVAARIALLAFAIATAVAGIWAAATLDVRAGWFECPHCKELFVPPMADYVKGCHTFTKRRLTCPRCGQTAMCRHRVAR